MRSEKMVYFSMFCLLLVPTLVNSCQALEEEECSINIEAKVSCSPPYQSVASVVVSVEIRNMGNATFNGTLTITITGKTDKGHHYSPVEHTISNLTGNEVRHFSKSFASYDEGIYWFTIEIEPLEIEYLMRVYEDSTLKYVGRKISIERSILLHSFTEFIAIVGIAVTAILGISTIVVKFVIGRKREKEKEKGEEEESRKEKRKRKRKKK